MSISDKGRDKSRTGIKWLAMNVKEQNVFGQLLRQAREVAGISRGALAGLVGLSISYIHRIETGNRRPSRESLITLAEALEVEGESLNKWLLAAGYAPAPLLNLMRSAVRTRGGMLRLHTDANQPTGPEPARWLEWLEGMGLKEEAIERLMKGMENARLPERKMVTDAVAATLRHVTEVLEAPVRTAVIPAAGGYHQLIAHHVMQRLLLRAIREAVECGISEIVIVLAPGMVDSLFTPLKESLDVMIAPCARLRYCIQPRRDGLGDALLKAEAFVGQEPFAVLLPDDVPAAHAGQAAYARELHRMMDVQSRLRGAHLIAVSAVPRTKMRQYGIAQVGDPKGMTGATAIEQLIEKPDPAHPVFKSPRALGIVGRYLLDPEIFGALRELEREGQRPIHLTSALDVLRQAGREVYAFELKGARQDIGEVLGQASELIESSAYGGSAGSRG